MDIKKELKNQQKLILNTVQKIFAYFGLKKPTINNVASKAGIGKDTVYIR